MISASGIVNGASGLAGPVAPGEIITVYGTGFGPTSPVRGMFVNGILESTVGETRVLVDGVAAPILTAASNQVSAIVPYSVLGRESVAFEVEYRGQKSPAVRLNTTSASPALFTQNNSGTGQAAATNQDGSFNSAENPTAGGVCDYALWHRRRLSRPGRGRWPADYRRTTETCGAGIGSHRRDARASRVCRWQSGLSGRLVADQRSSSSRFIARQCDTGSGQRRRSYSRDGVTIAIR